MNADQPPTPMKNETPITKLPDDSGCFTTTILSRDEAMALPLKDRPLNYRISSEIYHAVFEAVGAASLCWNPKPGDEVFDASAASKIATDLCFKIAKDIEKTFPDQPPTPTPNVSETPKETCSECNWTNVGLWNLGEAEAPRWVCQGCAKRAFDQLAAVTKERDEWKRLYGLSDERADNMESERDHAEANMDAALARAEKAEEDTRRLDWLEQQFGLAIWRGVMIDDNKPVFDIHEPREEGWDDALGEELGSGRTLRAAIDAALTHTKEPAP